MKLAQAIAELNEFHFFREFTFSQTTFRPNPSQELELADNVVWIGETLFVYQLKEREDSFEGTAEDEANWFERKVLKKATKQIRDTLTYVQTNDSITLQNHRAHTFQLRGSTIKTLHKLIVYRPGQNLPNVSRLLKCHTSSTAGVIHVLSDSDYLGIVRTLLTPAELSDYLTFRESLINRNPAIVHTLPEQALLGQYLSGQIDASPSPMFIDYLASLEHHVAEWDISRLITIFRERRTHFQTETDYYAIITELAQLMRNELKEFKTRCTLTMEKAKTNTWTQPYRMAIPRTNCGFVFVVVVNELVENRTQGLMNLCLANKYDLRLPKSIGLSLRAEADGTFSAEWCYAAFPWKQDAEIESLLAKSYPFRKVNIKPLDRYAFKDNSDNQAR